MTFVVLASQAVRVETVTVNMLGQGDIVARVERRKQIEALEDETYFMAAQIRVRSASLNADTSRFRPATLARGWDWPGRRLRAASVDFRRIRTAP